VVIVARFGNNFSFRLTTSGNSFKVRSIDNGDRMTPEELKDRMDGAGWNTQKVADHLRVTARTVRYWLTGAHPMPHTSAVALTALTTPDVMRRSDG